jgi:cytochrome c oxidase cbb3-type subunit 4
VSIVEMMSDARAVLTVLCLLTFLGIVFWTFSGARTASFREAEQLPFADEGLDENTDPPTTRAPAGSITEERNV